MIDDLIRAIAATDADTEEAARRRHAGLAKPPGSLGMLEDLGVQLAGIAGACPPPIPASPALVLAAGDHGVHAQGVSPWPQAISTAVTAAAAGGRASSSVLAAGAGATMVVLDVGLVTPTEHPAVRAIRVRAGTRDLTVEPAMTAEEATAAIRAGADAVHTLADDGADLVATGDMGIANTTASACLVAALTGTDPARATGRGTGIDDATLAHKQRIVAAGLARHGADRDPLRLLASLGGLEHAALVGVILAGAARRIPVVLDGVIADAAALVAVALAPACGGYLIAGHRSTEPGATVALAHLGLEPVLDLRLRLGEGTGALLAIPLVQAAARILRDLAPLDDLDDLVPGDRTDPLTDPHTPMV